jgi:L-alanine-DL-glutamate epimerase-like enolase superfamily enzyme
LKITRIETIPIRVPVKPEFAIRSGRGGSHTMSPFLLVKVHTDEGIVGIGESSCTPRWSGEDQFTGEHLIHSYLEPLLIGEDPVQVERLTREKFRLAFAANYFTKAAVEMALWDIAGKAAGKPVYELLGGKVRDAIATKWSVSGVEPTKAAEIARWAVDQGFGAMKVKVGIDSASDLARVRAVRQEIGPDNNLGVDANGGWTVASAIETIVKLEHECGIYFAEQPLPPEDVLAMRELRRKVHIPIVADESIYTLQDARTLTHLEAADVFSIYVGKAGGISPAKQIADFALASGLKCTIGSNLELGVGSAAMIHLGLAARGIDPEAFPCDIIGPFYYQTDVLRQPLLIAPGKASAGSRPLPGLGVELDEEKVATLRLSDG